MEDLFTRLTSAKESVIELEHEVSKQSTSMMGSSVDIPLGEGASTLSKATPDLVHLMPGNFIWLKQEDESCKGTIVGNVSLRTVDMVQQHVEESAKKKPLFENSIFRLCSRMNYRSKVEVSRILKDMRNNPGKVQRPAEELALSERRAANEAIENAELMERLRLGANECLDPVRYGDVIQLQHAKSGLFLAMHKDPATQNPQCRKVSLKMGSLAAQFTIVPRFRVHAPGSVVNVNDRVLLQSVKHENFFLGGSEPPLCLAATGARRRSSPSTISDTNLQGRLSNASSVMPSQLGACSDHPSLHLRVPSVLKSEALCEVNGSMEPRCLRLKLFGTTNPSAGLTAGVRNFRIFHPYSASFMRASSDPDKGEMLDGLGTPEDPFTRRRVGGVPAHVPFLKPLASATDVANPANFSAKACWAFELADDPTRCGEVRWRETAVRIRHITSKKLLSVKSVSPADLVSAELTNKMLAESGEIDNEDQDGNKTTRAPPVIFDTCLVADIDPTAKEGNFGSKISTIFYIEPVDEEGADGVLRDGATNFRLVHKPPGCRDVLHFIAPREQKPRYEDKSTEHNHSLENLGGRICFSSRLSPLDVLKIMPLTDEKASQLHKLLAFIPLFKKWSFCFHAAAVEGGDISPPLGLAEFLVSACFDIIDMLRSGKPPPRRHGGNVSEAMKEASDLSPAALSSLFIMGSQDQFVQRAAQQIKLLDAVFEAVIAPYNYACEALGESVRPFSEVTGPVIKYLNLVIERCLSGNVDVQAYFAKQSARRWVILDETPKHENGEVYDDPVIRNVRVWTPLPSILIEHTGESLGASLVLEPLLNSTEKIVNSLVSEDLLDRFVGLFERFGPDVRFSALFKAICFVERRPSRAHQELCLRKLWLHPVKRYKCSVSFHTIHEDKKKFGKVFCPRSDKVVRDPCMRTRVNPSEAPKSFLGQTKENEYGPICVGWSSTPNWEPDCGKLWWSAASMHIRVTLTIPMEGMEPMELVRIEELMWVLDPKRLAKPVTGSHWYPLDDQTHSAAKPPTREKRRKALAHRTTAVDMKSLTRLRKFDRQKVLALHVVAQINLFARLACGRNYPAIRVLEQHFSYDVLMNLSTNPLLPFDLSSAAMGFVEALYLDRFPHRPINGARRLWILEDGNDPKEDYARSSVPVVTRMDLENESAFPHFSLPPSSSAFTDPSPVLSHSTHFKFALHSNHCNSVVKIFGEAGVVHQEEMLNRLGMAAIRGSQMLLKYGFQSTYSKLLELCVPLGKLLDGRCDLANTATAFESPGDRYKDDGQFSVAVTKLRKEVVDLFFGITDLRSDYRLGQLLNGFKIKLKEWESRSTETSSSARRFFQQKTLADKEEMFTLFEEMFPGGKGEGAKLDLAVLSGHSKIDEALCDCLMYENDELMAAALRLIYSTYGQRLHLRKVIKEVVLLDRAHIPVYGNVHALRIDISQLDFLVRTSFVWGVSSDLSGPFGDPEFRKFMEIVDRLIKFMSNSLEDSSDCNSLPPRRLPVLVHADHSVVDYVDYEHEVDNPVWFGAKKRLSSVDNAIDIASKWYKELRTCSFEPEHQEIVASLDILPILQEATALDPRIASKNHAEASVQDIEESFRRLNQAKQALLCLASAFCSSCTDNQDQMFSTMGALETIAAGTTGSPEERSMDATAELAQHLILVILRGNQANCEKIPSSVIGLFSAIANGHTDVSISPALEFFFIIARPEHLAIKASQDMIVNHIIASSENFLGHQNLVLALSSCASEEAAIAMAASSGGKGRAGNRSNLCRLVQLLRVLVEGGNEPVAVLLKLSLGLTIDSVCAGMLAFLEGSRPVGAENVELSPGAVLNLLSKPGSFGSSLFLLFVELMFLLPISSTQIMSPTLWAFMERGIVPAMEALAHMDPVPAVIVDFMDVIDRCLTFIVRLGFYQRVMEHKVRGTVMSDIVEDTATFLSSLQATHEEGNTRTTICAQRIVRVHAENGADIGALQFNRLAEYKDKVKSTQKKVFLRRVSAKLFLETSRDGQAFGDNDDEFDSATTKVKFDIFCSALLNNKFILSSMQRRRFMLVSVLEAGLKGPPEDVGREMFLSTASLPRADSAQNVKKKNKKHKKPHRTSKVVPTTYNATFAKSISDDEEMLAAVDVIQSAFRRYAHSQERKFNPSSQGVKMPINRYRAAVKVTWTDITARFVNYIRRHFWQPGYGRATSVLIFDTWSAHLVKARTWGLDEDGNKISVSDTMALKGSTLKLCTPFELNEHEFIEYQRRQVCLSMQGVSALLAEVICGLESDLSHHGLPSCAIDVFIELLLGGNTHVQNDLYAHLVQEDTEGKLVQHLERRLALSFDNLVEAKKTRSLGANLSESSMPPLYVQDCESIITTARFLQLLCEGHQTSFQNYLRTQPMCTREVDLIKKVETILVFMCESSFVVSRFMRIEVDLVSQLVATLIELTQGPCTGNQEHVAGGDVVMALNFIVPSGNQCDAALAKDNPDYKDMRGLGCILLAACLEGHKDDSPVHAKLSRRLEVEPLLFFRNQLEAEIKLITGLVKHQHRLPNGYESKRINVLQSEHVAVVTVLTSLFSAIMYNSPKADHDLVGFIEISWRGEIQGTFFPLPFEIAYLSADTKEAFLDEVDLSTTEKRMKTLIKASGSIISQMRLIYQKAEQERAYQLIYSNLPRVRLGVYLVAFFLNMAILFSPPASLLEDSGRRRQLKKSASGGASTAGSNASGEGSVSGQLDLVAPFWALVGDLDGSEPLSQVRRTNVLVTLACAALVLTGYAAITHNLSVTELPLVIEEVDAGFAESAEVLEKSSGSGKEDGGAGRHHHRGLVFVAWRPLVLSSGATGLLSVFHAFTHYGVHWSLYAFGCLVVNSLFFLIGLRAHVITSSRKQPPTSFGRTYAIAYDCFVKRTFLRNHVVLAFFCLLGCFYSDEFFTFQLLDVVSVSPVIADIIKSVTSPGFSLALVFYLFCVTVIIWARLGMKYFAEFMEVPNYDVESGVTDYQQCTSMLGCFAFIFYQGLAEMGNILAVLSKVSPGTHVYHARIVYDSIFVVWVGIVLVNIITGLMVDTFSAIREEKAHRVQTLSSECFVCGIHRDAYEDIATSDLVPSFDVHMAQDHNLWTYVHYLAYIKQKDPTEDNGIESFVRKQFAEGGLDWIPSRTCIALENQQHLEEQHRKYMEMQQHQQQQRGGLSFSMGGLLEVGNLGAGLANDLAGGILGGGKAGMAGMEAGLSGVKGGVSSLLGMASRTAPSAAGAIRFPSMSMRKKKM